MNLPPFLQIWNGSCSSPWWKYSFGYGFKIKFNCCKWYLEIVNNSLFNKRY